MNILTCAPKDSSFNKVSCCVCEKEMYLNHTFEYVVTKSGFFLSTDCIDRLTRENKRS